MKGRAIQIFSPDDLKNIDVIIAALRELVSSINALVNQIPQYPLFGDYRGIVGDLTFRPYLGGGGFDTNEGILLNACALC